MSGMRTPESQKVLEGEGEGVLVGEEDLGGPKGLEGADLVAVEGEEVEDEEVEGSDERGLVSVISKVLVLCESFGMTCFVCV